MYTDEDARGLQAQSHQQIPELRLRHQQNYDFNLVEPPTEFFPVF